MTRPLAKRPAFLVYRTTLGFARLVGTEPVAVLLAPTTDSGPWRTLYRDGGAWREGTKGDDVIAAAKAMNARVRSLGVECDDEVPGWGAIGGWMVGAT